MYKASPPVYGWQSYGQRNSDVVALPLSPVRRRQRGGMCDCDDNCINWYSFGIVLSILAAASLAIGVADVVVTYQHYMVDMDCMSSMMAAMTPCMPDNLIWTWIAVGIWASIFPFVLGILAIRRATDPAANATAFEVFGYLSAFLFTPALVVLSAIEIWKGTNVYYWDFQTPLPMDDMVKFALPLAIAILGFIEFIMCFLVIAHLCGCCDGDDIDGVAMTTGRAPVMASATSCNSCAVATRPSAYSSGCGGCNSCNVQPQRASMLKCASGSCGTSRPYGGCSTGNCSGNYFPGGGFSSGYVSRPTTYNYQPNSAYNFYKY